MWQQTSRSAERQQPDSLQHHVRPSRPSLQSLARFPTDAVCICTIIYTGNHSLLPDPDPAIQTALVLGRPRQCIHPENRTQFGWGILERTEVRLSCSPTVWLAANSQGAPEGVFRNMRNDEHYHSIFNIRTEWTWHSDKVWKIQFDM